MVYENRWIKLNPDYDRQMYTAITNVGFINPLSTLEVAQLTKKLGEIFADPISQKLFEGISKCDISQNALRIDFTFSLDKAHMENVESLIGRRGLQSHRLNYMQYVYAEIDKLFKLDDSLSDTFRELGDMNYLMDEGQGD